MNFGKNANRKPAFMKCDNCNEETTGQDTYYRNGMWCCESCYESQMM